MEGLVRCKCGCNRYIRKEEYDYMNKENIMHTETALAMLVRSGIELEDNDEQ